MPGFSTSAGSNIIFVTGTDTGVGKTLLTGLLLCHLRQNGCRALALKPFCSGDRADAELLSALQDGDLKLEEINPFHFAEPLAPLVAARKHRRNIVLQDVVNHITRIAACLSTPSPSLLIEGIGGLLVPLGQGFTVADLISRLHCRVIVVSRNQLGTINHTLLTVRSLQAIGVKHVSVALMDSRRSDPSALSNPQVLTELLAPVPVLRVPFLGTNPLCPGGLKNKSKKTKKVLAQFLR